MPRGGNWFRRRLRGRATNRAPSYARATLPPLSQPPRAGVGLRSRRREDDGVRRGEPSRDRDRGGRRLARRGRLVHGARQDLDGRARHHAGGDGSGEATAGRVAAVRLRLRRRAGHGLGARRRDRPSRSAHPAHRRDLGRVLLARLRHHHDARQQQLRPARLAAPGDRRRPLAVGAAADGRDHRRHGRLRQQADGGEFPSAGERRHAASHHPARAGRAFTALRP